MNQPSLSFRAATHVSGGHSDVLEGDNEPFAVPWVQSNNCEFEPERILFSSLPFSPALFGLLPGLASADVPTIFSSTHGNIFCSRVIMQCLLH